MVVCSRLSRDIGPAVTSLTRTAVSGYLVVFGIEAGMLALAVLMLTAINVDSFHKQVEAPSVVERVALAE